MKRGRLFALWMAAACASSADASEPQRYQREDVLGTSLEMIVVEADVAQADAALAAALREIHRLEAVLSTWKNDSELSHFNASQGPEKASIDLRRVLSLCEAWRQRTQGAFSCRLGSLLDTWRAAASSQPAVLPDRATMRKQARKIASLEFEITRGPLPHLPGLNWQVDGLAKGYILDRAMEKARKAAPKATGIKLDIGGDAVYWGYAQGQAPWRVAIADPNAPRDNANAIAMLELRSLSIASSGHRTRGFRIGRRHYSHILEASEGWPADYAPSATVVAPDAATADALATALSVMPISDGLTLVESLPGVEAMVVGDRGVPFASSGWHALLSGEPAVFRIEKVEVDYEIPARPGADYRKPYLALWVTTPAGEPVRQLLVLGDRSRWLRELPQWWRRYGREDEAAVHGIARPTREPGKYALSWDGRDDYGRMLAPGRYVLQVEAAREHGGHEVLALPFELDRGAAAHETTGTSEVGRVSLRSGPRQD